MTPEREFSRHTAGIMLELLQEPCRKWFLTGCSGTVLVNDIVPSSCTSSPQCLVQFFEFDHGPPMHCRNVQIFEQDQACFASCTGRFVRDRVNCSASCARSPNVLVSHETKKGPRALARQQ